MSKSLLRIARRFSGERSGTLKGFCQENCSFLASAWFTKFASVLRMYSTMRQFNPEKNAPLLCNQAYERAF